MVFSPSEKITDIPNYVLASHGEMGAQEVKSIIGQHPEILSKILGEEYNQKEADETIITIENAIRCHMGPNPGFIEKILESVNKVLKRRGESEIKYPYPEKGDVVAETLLAADMCSLAGRKGREKVLAIRSNVPFFKEQDEILSKEYEKFGLDLSPGEAALLSGFDSAEQSRDMLKDLADREWVNKAIEASKEKDYLYEGKKVNYAQASVKREEFEKAKKIEMAA